LDTGRLSHGWDAAATSEVGGKRQLIFGVCSRFAPGFMAARLSCRQCRDGSHLQPS
jgi:hypothetical protein